MKETKRGMYEISQRTRNYNRPKRKMMEKKKKEQQKRIRTRI